MGRRKLPRASGSLPRLPGGILIFTHAAAVVNPEIATAPPEPTDSEEPLSLERVGALIQVTNSAMPAGGAFSKRPSAAQLLEIDST